MIKLKEIYEKMMNTKSFIIILIIGVTLMIMPGFSKSDKQEQKNDLYEFNIADYEESLEKRLSQRLSEISGAGKVSVMITFSDCGRYTYSKEEQSEKSETSSKGNSKPVLKDSSRGGEEPILIKAEFPKISGVLVIAEGAGNNAVKENITEAVKAVLGVSAKNISVACR